MLSPLLFETTPITPAPGIGAPVPAVGVPPVCAVGVAPVRPPGVGFPPTPPGRPGCPGAAVV